MADEPSSSRSVPAPGDVFVGRGDLIEALAECPPDDEALIVDLHGPPGSGKTTLLRHVRHRLPEVRPTAVLRIAVDESDGRGAAAADASELARSQAYARFREVLSKLVRDILQLEEDAGRDVGRAERNMDDITVALTNAGDLANGTTAVGLGHAIVTSQSDLSQTFAECYPLVLDDRPALVTIDNFEHVATGALGPWLLDVVRRLPRTVAIVARTRAVSAIVPHPEAGVIDRPLPPLTRDDIREMLATCLPGVPVTDGVVDVVERRSCGNAEDVARAVLRIQQLEPPLEPSVVEEHLTGSESTRDPATEVAPGVTALVPPALEPIVRRCCVLRKFDAEFLEAFLDLPPGKGGEVIKDLRRNLLIEEDADPRGGFFRLDALTRGRFEDELMRDDRAGWRRENQRAADLIHAWLTEYDEGDGLGGQEAYGAWYRYERPEWQAAAREWLHYEARGADPEDRTRSRMHCAHHFFDAFFWWGCYMPFPFISGLLDDWESTQDDAELAPALRTFLAEYPTGYRKDPQPERWESVLDSLLEVRDLCGLPASAAELDEDARHVGAMIQIFLAHACRYRAAADDAERARLYERAAGYYDAAVSLFRQEEDPDWGVAWTLLERAELHAEHGDGRARDDWRESAALAGGLGDDELAANLYRLAADVRWPDSPSDAFAAHGRAVLHAYLFQGRYQVSNPYRPDAYTQAFYDEQVDRAVDRLMEHAREGGDLWEAAAGLGAPFPWVQAVDGDELARRCAEGDRGALRLLLPGRPSTEELLLTKSAFMKDWRKHREQLGNPSTKVEESAW